ncbi:DUF2336 domain-containing protein [Brevundimonas sp. PAMC22021]|nr:DUF2336 domain-containing protein [Brevundimonas sp. PAMC22021]
MADLVELARSRSADDRRRLLSGVLTLCRTEPGVRASPVLSDIFMTLARQAERDVRFALSQALAAADWAPPPLIHILALDDIEIARPIIAASPLLADADLLRILVEATLEHQIEVARRPHLSPVVADAIIDQAEPAPLTALAGNTSARLSDEAMRRLVEHSRRIAGLRSPLSRHPRLTEVLAAQLYAWVGQALREAINERFQIEDARLAPAIDRAVDQARGRTGSFSLGATDPAASDEADRRLVMKLQAGGQLRAGLLVRALREDRLSLFENVLAALTGFPFSQIQAALRAPGPEALFLACTAAGVDKAVFSPMLLEVRRLCGGLPGGDAHWRPPVVTREGAAQMFRRLTAAPHSSAV